MKIAIDISPLQTGHAVRGVGFYLQHLKDALIKYTKGNEYCFFTNPKEISTDTDIVHYPYFEPFFVTLPFNKKYKTIVTVHDLTPLVFPKHFPAGLKGNISWRIQKFNLKKSDAIITDSISSKKDIEKYTGISNEKIHSVYLAAGEEFAVIKGQESRIRDVKKKYSLPDKFVLYVGDVTWNKNLPSLVKAVKKLNISLVMVGKVLKQEEFDKNNIWNRDLLEIQSLTENDKRFIKLGFVSQVDLVLLYNIANVFAFPSIYEGFGLPVLEAMQSGCPVVTTKGGSLDEIADGATYFVDEYSVDDIASGIKKVFEDKKIQEELSKKGLQQAKKFTWKKTAEETVEVYRKVLDFNNKY